MSISISHLSCLAAFYITCFILLITSWKGVPWSIGQLVHQSILLFLCWTCRLALSSNLWLFRKTQICGSGLLIRNNHLRQWTLILYVIPQNSSIFLLSFWISGCFCTERVLSKQVFIAVKSKVTENLSKHSSPETRSAPGQPWVRGWDDKRGIEGPKYGNQWWDMLQRMVAVLCLSIILFCCPYSLVLV